MYKLLCVDMHAFLPSFAYIHFVHTIYSEIGVFLLNGKLSGGMLIFCLGFLCERT
eukprot:c43141_g1_i1 orf=2-163(-)